MQNGLACASRSAASRSLAVTAVLAASCACCVAMTESPLAELEARCTRNRPGASVREAYWPARPAALIQIKGLRVRSG
jgi:hypothetical protein